MSSIEPTAISRPRTPDLISGYRLEKLVGAGGMGEVHKATQLSLGRTVAVKLLNPELAKDPSFIARFQKEAAALAALSHPHVVAIVDKGKTDSTYYLVMEFVDGPSLRELMRSPQLDTPLLLRRMLEICRAIEYAHGRGVIHRDLKPENILLDQQAGGIAKVSDFGLASFLDDATVASRYALTSTHVSMGTISYMAPEQRVDAKSADARADIFSLGVILYETFAGEVPLGTFDPPSRKRPGLDPRVDAIVMRCLKPDPDDRYPSVSALIADLEPLVPGSLLSMPPLRMTRMQRVKHAVRRAARVVAQTAALLVVLAALGVLGVAWHRSGQVHTQVMPGAAIMGKLGADAPRNGPGRLEDVTPDKRRVTMGEGPDSPQFLVAGRRLSFENKALVFPPRDDWAGSEDDRSQSENKTNLRVGRARVDVMGLVGGVARLSARVRAEAPPPTWVRRLKEVLEGPPPDPVAAILLTGREGRFVALVHHGAGAPLALEWALGERRGTMLGLPSPAGEARLELFVTEDGVMQAFVGQGKDQRPIAEPLDLGPDWQGQFGEPPAPAVGCIEGTCSFEGFTYTVDRPVPVAEAPSTPMVVAPQQQPARTVASNTVPAKAVVPKKVTPPPPPPKRQPVKAAPAKSTKRR
ncbi:MULTISPECIES: serine/threonine-protein kinase [Corallococcus]|uniref:serine/threonine-protein kinase n=1 Tax=Corallococcus TaxID=83461 RepID=UPI00117C2EF6|nr:MULTISPECIES: serine/threonine-protein kinase [Corallococcus]NBD07637.1 protein kinase [Corallococcus silvisoli]TSC33639.1 serine/threonine protein kinase [Corallococcus sp. Z5C101001]